MSLLEGAATPVGTCVFALRADTPATVNGPVEAPFAMESTADGGDMLIEVGN